jgi:hypothetical protein
MSERHKQNGSDASTEKRACFVDAAIVLYRVHDGEFISGERRRQ